MKSLRKLYQLIRKIVVYISNKILLHDLFVNKIVHHSGLLERIILHKEFVNKTVSNNKLLERIVLDDCSYEKVLETVEFVESLGEFRHVINKDKINSALPYNFIKVPLRERKNLINRKLLDLICEKEKVSLANGVMKYTERNALWILINEVLINEDYYFETDTDSPKILDCGTHFGIAIYYFKSLYPKARITGFEPNPEIRELALENIKKNNFSDVEVLPYALAEKEKIAQFIISLKDSMAGSLTERRLSTGEPVYAIKVQCKRLSQYLQEPVHYLKLDIEGSENVVLKEAKTSLENVQYIFCEYHHGLGLKTDRLGEILSLLDNAGFDVHVGKSWSLHNFTVHRPMNHVANPYSAVIWAKNRNWKY